MCGVCGSARDCGASTASANGAASESRCERTPGVPAPGVFMSGVTVGELSGVLSGVMKCPDEPFGLKSEPGEGRRASAPAAAGATERGAGTEDSGGCTSQGWGTTGLFGAGLCEGIGGLPAARGVLVCGVEGAPERGGLGSATAAPAAAARRRVDGTGGAEAAGAAADAGGWAGGVASGEATRTGMTAPSGAAAGGMGRAAATPSPCACAPAAAGSAGRSRGVRRFASSGSRPF